MLELARTLLQRRNRAGDRESVPNADNQRHANIKATSDFRRYPIG